MQCAAGDLLERLENLKFRLSGHGIEVLQQALYLRQAVAHMGLDLAGRRSGLQ